MPAFFARLKRGARYCYSRYVYQPRLGKRVERLRLIRVLLLLAISTFAFAYYAVTSQLQIPFLPLAGEESVGRNEGDTLNVPMRQQVLEKISAPSEASKAEQQMPRQHHQVSVMDARNLRAFELERRLKGNWRKIESMLDEFQARANENANSETIASASGSPIPAFAATMQGEELSEQNAYELLIESRLQQIGDQLYRARHNSRNLDGSALVRFTLTSDGALDQVEMLASSGNALIDQLLLESVYAAAPYARFSPGMNQPYLIMERWLRVTPAANP